MTLKDLKILLLKMDMTATQLARRLGCHPTSIYYAFNRADRPGILRKIRAFYDQNNRRVA